MGDTAQHRADATDAAAPDDDLIGLVDVCCSDDRRCGGSDADVAHELHLGEGLAVTLQGVQLTGTVHLFGADGPRLASGPATLR